MIQFFADMSDTIEIESCYGLEYAVPDRCARKYIGPGAHQGLFWKEGIL